jgi:hypothetical protein
MLAVTPLQVIAGEAAIEVGDAAGEAAQLLFGASLGLGQLCNCLFQPGQPLLGADLGLLQPGQPLLGPGLGLGQATYRLLEAGDPLLGPGLGLRQADEGLLQTVYPAFKAVYPLLQGAQTQLHGG